MKIEVHLQGGLRKIIDITPGATVGATIGRNVFNADGTLFVPSTGGGGDPVSVTSWELILNIPPNVTALANTITTGLYVVTGSGTSATRAITSVAGETTVANGSGVAGDPAIGLADVTPSSGGSIQRLGFDAKGRRSQADTATTDNLPEGATNLYFTDARAQAAVVVPTITDGDTTHSPSGDAVFDALAGKDDAGAADAALLAATTYTDDVVPPHVLFCDVINGRVGVGTQTPTFQFHVEGATAGLYLNRMGGAESFIALAIGGTTQGQLRADASGYLKVTNALGSTELIRLGPDLGVIGGRLFGTALHNNAGGITGTTNQYVGSGTYTPTLTNGTNVAASTSFTWQYIRVGNVMHASGTINIDPTAASVATQIGISLPLASDLNSYVQCTGVAVSQAGAVFGVISGDTTNDRATLDFTNGVSTANASWFITLTCLIR